MPASRMLCAHLPVLIPAQRAFESGALSLCTVLRSGGTHHSAGLTVGAGLSNTGCCLGRLDVLCCKLTNTHVTLPCCPVLLVIARIC